MERRMATPEGVVAGIAGKREAGVWTNTAAEAHLR